ncbi:hypothetical protein GJAV_G00093840 [Gymnothorax javanicus]|nr:hypothetical protein GJAV_G00093840 [Gymnothorax javanicus]
MNCVAAFSSGLQPRKIQKVHVSIECFKMHNEGQDTDPSMSNLVTFQTQLASIMEILAKAAVAEINRRVDDSCAVFRLEISQSQREIETLKHKLQVLESEFMKSRRKKTATVEHSSPAERLIVQEWSFRPTEGEDPMALEEVESFFQPSIKRSQLQPEPLPIKKERMEEGFCYSDSQLTSTGEEQETQTAPVEQQQGKEPTPVGDPEELKEQHRCGHSDEELSGLEFVVKAEQEEEHVRLMCIMETLAKTAVVEIEKLLEDNCAVLRLEMSRCHLENEKLKRKIRRMECELATARGCGEAAGARESHSDKGWSPAKSVFGQEWGFTPRLDGEPAGVEDVETPVQSDITQNQVRAELVLVKQEATKQDLCYGGPHPASTGKEQVTQPTPVEVGNYSDTESTPEGDAEELRELHRCGHGDEELSGLEFVVKAEQEDEHVAQRLNQAGCELGAERLNTLDSECVMYERDNQLWTSFTQGSSDIECDDPVCSNATEQCSQSLSVHSPIHHTPAYMEGSGNPLSSFGASYAEEFDKMVEEPSVCSEELSILNSRVDCILHRRQVHQLGDSEEYDDDWL